MFETWEDNVRRETREETGLILNNIRFVTATNNIIPEENGHSVTLYHVADWVEGEPQTLEPDKCEGWHWFQWNNLPQPLFIAARIFHENGYNPFTI
jgi:8-oxo-dGTP diphosphatase